MHKKTIKSNRKINSRQQQSRAVVNLRQLSQSPWHHHYQQTPVISQSVVKQKSINQTNQSLQLPLNPKQPVIPQSPTKISNKPLYNQSRFNYQQKYLNQPRPNTIHHGTVQLSSQGSRLSKNKYQPLTSLNFYEDIKRSYNTFDDRSRLNQQIQLFASRIKHQTNLIKSIEMKRAKTTGIKQLSTSLPFKANIAKKSFFYKQFKNFLYDSFKVDGKPVQIKRDRYSIQSHGLPKKKSIYSFKQKTNNDFFIFNKTDILRQKVRRYDMDLNNNRYNNDQNEEDVINEKQFIKRKSISVYQQSQNSLMSQTLHVRHNDRENRRRLKGKLWLGRPPTSLVVQQG